jgi:hypothetical protein
MSRSPNRKSRPNPVADELHAEFPLLWERSLVAYYDERMYGSPADPLDLEAGAAMHELWLARTNLRDRTTLGQLEALGVAASVFGRAVRHELARPPHGAVRAAVAVRRYLRRHGHVRGGRSP